MICFKNNLKNKLIDDCNRLHSMESVEEVLTQANAGLYFTKIMMPSPSRHISELNALGALEGGTELHFIRIHRYIKY